MPDLEPRGMKNGLRLPGMRQGLTIGAVVWLGVAAYPGWAQSREGLLPEAPSALLFSSSVGGQQEAQQQAPQQTQKQAPSVPATPTVQAPAVQAPAAPMGRGAGSAVPQAGTKEERPHRLCSVHPANLPGPVAADRGHRVCVASDFESKGAAGDQGGDRSVQPAHDCGVLGDIGGGGLRTLSTARDFRGGEGWRDTASRKMCRGSLRESM